MRTVGRTYEKAPRPKAPAKVAAPKVSEPKAPAKVAAPKVSTTSTPSADAPKE